MLAAVDPRWSRTEWPPTAPRTTCRRPRRTRLPVHPARVRAARRAGRPAEPRPPAPARSRSAPSSRAPTRSRDGGIAARSARAVDVEDGRHASSPARVARRVPPSLRAESDRWGGDQLARADGRYDVHGRLAQRRAEALARSPRAHRPARFAPPFESALSHGRLAELPVGERKSEHLRSARTIVNVRRSELATASRSASSGSVERLRGPLEHSLGAAPFMAGEHFVTFYPEDLSTSSDALLDDESASRDAAQAAYRLLKDPFPMRGPSRCSARRFPGGLRCPGPRRVRQSLPHRGGARAAPPEFVRLQRHGELDRA